MTEQNNETETPVGKWVKPELIRLDDRGPDGKVAFAAEIGADLGFS